MGFPHLSIDLAALVAIRLYLWQSLDIPADNEWKWILFLVVLVVLEEMVENDDLINLFAMRVVALLDMFLHLSCNPQPLLLNQVDVLLLVHHVLLTTHLVLYLLQRIGRQHTKLLMDLLLH